MLTTLSGKKVPLIALGTYPLQGERMASNVYEAIKIGYRLIDTSDDYRNEDGVGLGCERAIFDGIVKREDLFLLTKVSDDGAYSDEYLLGTYFCKQSQFMKRHTVYEVVREKVENSLYELRTDYLDALCVHHAYEGFYEQIWEAMIRLHKEGLVRYIGVSNCGVRHMEVLSHYEFRPQFNESYFSPICTKNEVVKYCHQQGVQLLTYSPLIDIRGNRLTDILFAELAAKYKVSVAQLVLAWNIGIGSIPLPKSQSVRRLQENFDALKVTLSSEDIAKLSLLNYNRQYSAESKTCPGL